MPPKYLGDKSLLICLSPAVMLPSPFKSSKSYNPVCGLTPLLWYNFTISIDCPITYRFAKVEPERFGKESSLFFATATLKFVDHLKEFESIFRVLTENSKPEFSTVASRFAFNDKKPVVAGIGIPTN